MSHPDNSTRGVAPDPAPGPTLLWGVVGIVVTVLVILLCEVGFHIAVERRTAEKQGAVDSSEARVLEAEQKAWLASESEDRSRISIDHAMGDVVDRYGKAGR